MPDTFGGLKQRGTRAVRRRLAANGREVSSPTRPLRGKTRACLVSPFAGPVRTLAPLRSSGEAHLVKEFGLSGHPGRRIAFGSLARRGALDGRRRADHVRTR